MRTSKNMAMAGEALALVTAGGQCDCSAEEGSTAAWPALTSRRLAQPPC
jgi:hypothetical protein